MRAQISWILSILTLTLGAGLAGPTVGEKGVVNEAAAKEASPIEFSVAGAWDSRYVSEARDNLNGAGLLSSTVEFGLAGFTFCAWYANSYDVAYSELDLVLEYGFEFRDFEAYFYYGHLRYPHDDNASENEVGAGLSYTAMPGGFVPGVDWYYLAESDGSWIELSLAYPIELTDRIALEPAVIAGFNAGYLGDGHDGANAVALTLPVTYALTDNIELSAYASYQWEIDSDPVHYGDDELLTNFFWGGVALTVSL